MGFEVQWNGYVQLSITVLMESKLLWKVLAAARGRCPIQAGRAAPNSLHITHCFRLQGPDASGAMAIILRRVVSGHSKIVLTAPPVAAPYIMERKICSTPYA